MNRAPRTPMVDPPSAEQGVTGRTDGALIAPRLLDVKAAAQYLGGLSVFTVRRLIADGVVPVVRLPALRRRDETMRRILIDIRDLDRLIESSRERAGA